MKRVGLLLLGMSLLGACRTAPVPPPKTQPALIDGAQLFPRPTGEQCNQLSRLDPLLRGPIRKLDLSWVVDMGLPAVPPLLHEASDETLSANARSFTLLVLGSTLKKADFQEQPGKRNDVVVPVIEGSLRDADPNVRRSAAFAGRFVDDGRLIPALLPLLGEQPSVQEQAVFALGTSGHDAEVVPIVKLFFATQNGTFRYSCLYSLAMICLRHNVDVAAILEQNTKEFGESNLQHVDSVKTRFIEFNNFAVLVRRLSSNDPAERREADEKLRKLTGIKTVFDADGNDAVRKQGAAEWQRYFLKDYWLVPSPSSPPKS